MALFRLSEPHSGRITIDGSDVSEMDVGRVRSSVSVIPQEPVLFVGSLRYNLDPFAQHTDAQIWRALEMAHMKQTVTWFS